MANSKTCVGAEQLSELMADVVALVRALADVTDEQIEEWPFTTIEPLREDARVLLAKLEA